VTLPGFAYHRAGTVDQALDMMVSLGEGALLLAGGHALVPLMKLRRLAPAALIDIGQIPELRHIRGEGPDIVIGAAVRYRDLERSELLRERVPLLASAAGQVGDRQVRARGTIGGGLACGDPAGDLPAVVMALDAVLETRSPRGRRRLSCAEFFLGHRRVGLEPEEMLVQIRIPSRSSGGAGCYEKFKRRAHGWATVGVAVVPGDLESGGEPTRVALANMGPTPLRATAVEIALVRGASAAEAARLAHQGAAPPSDVMAGAGYRTHLARVLVERALLKAGVS
jgi:carbon-monoxide dehydrogenase medium subunit